MTRLRPPERLPRSIARVLAHVTGAFLCVLHAHAAESTLRADLSELLLGAGADAQASQAECEWIDAEQTHLEADLSTHRSAIQSIQVEANGQPLFASAGKQVVEATLERFMLGPTRIALAVPGGAGADALKLQAGQRVTAHFADKAGAKHFFFCGRVSHVMAPKKGSTDPYLVYAYRPRVGSADLKTRSFSNVRHSDIVDQIASEYGLSAQVVRTSTTYSMVTQAIAGLGGGFASKGISDWTWLLVLAAKNAYDVQLSANKLLFQPSSFTPKPFSSRTQSWVKVKDSDVACQLAGLNGLSCRADDTGQQLPSISQKDVNDFRFLYARALSLGYGMHVDGNELFFKRDGSMDPPPVRESSHVPSPVCLDLVRTIAKRHGLSASEANPGELKAVCTEPRIQQTDTEYLYRALHAVGYRLDTRDGGLVLSRAMFGAQGDASDATDLLLSRVNIRFAGSAPSFRLTYGSILAQLRSPGTVAVSQVNVLLPAPKGSTDARAASTLVSATPAVMAAGIEPKFDQVLAAAPKHVGELTEAKFLLYLAGQYRRTLVYAHGTRPNGLTKLESLLKRLQ